MRAACAARVVERVMGFEPTTSTLARLHSTTELHPRETSSLAMARGPVNGLFRIDRSRRARTTGVDGA